MTNDHSESVVESPIRLSLRIGSAPGIFDKAVERIKASLDRRAKRFQLELEWNDEDGIASADIKSVGLSVRAKSSRTAFICATSEYLSAKSLSGRQDALIYLLHDGSLEVQATIARNYGKDFPRIAAPDFIPELATDSLFALTESSSGYRVGGMSVAFKCVSDHLASLIRNTAVIVVGKSAAISSRELVTLSKSCCGFATVGIIDDENDSLLAAQLPPGWNVPADGIRVFAPNLDFGGSPLRGSRLFMPIVVDEAGITDTTFGPLISTILWVAGQFTSTALITDPMPSFEDGERNVLMAIAGATDHPTGSAESNELSSDGRTSELQSTISELRTTIAIISEEKAFEEQVSFSWKNTAESQKAAFE